MNSIQELRGDPSDAEYAFPIKDNIMLCIKKKKSST
jgi:hypothetical protein